MDQPFGPCTARVEAMLERAGRLTPDEAHALWDAQVASNADELQFRAALRPSSIPVTTSAGRRRYGWPRTPAAPP